MKLDKPSKALKNLRYIHNGIKSAWSMKQLSNWADVRSKGIDIDNHKPEEPVKWEDLKSIMLKQEALYLGPTSEASGDKILDNLKPIVPSTDHIETHIVPTPNIIQVPKFEPTSHIVTKVIEEVEAEDKDFTESNNYGWIESKNQSPEHYSYWFQKKACAQLYQKVVIEKLPAVLLISGTGTGKTYIINAFNRRLIDEKYTDEETYCPTPFLYITKKTILEQTARVMRDSFRIRPNVEVDVINIEQLRSSKGARFLKYEDQIINGKEVRVWKWHEMVSPSIIELDESQGVKNPDSTQSECIQAYSLLSKQPAQIIHFSASPFAKVSEAKAFCIATKMDITSFGYPPGTKLSQATWDSFAHLIADGDPSERNEAAVDRLMDAIDKYVVRVKGVRPQYRAENITETIFFETDDERNFYQSAYERYAAAKTKYDESAGAGFLVELIQFSVAAEVCKAPQVAKRMANGVQQRGKAMVYGGRYKASIIRAVTELIEKHGVSRNDISIIWGGGTNLSAKQKAKRSIIDNKDKLIEAGMNIQELLDSLDLEGVETQFISQGLPDSYRLGKQSLKERQEEIDKFQSGRTKYCFFTFKAGGVGLSLHHTDTLTKFKCRRKKSGYAFEEDIPNVPVLPRETILATTWSPQELLQGLGRVPRLNSLSNTKQTILFYGGTIESYMQEVVTHGLRCLSKVVRIKGEDWLDIIKGTKSVDEVTKGLKKFKDDTSEDMITDTENDEDEDDEEEE